MRPTLLIMAAGLGSRYGGFKQVDRVGPAGEMLLEYAIFDAYRAGFRRIVFVIRHELTSAFAELARGLPRDLDVSCVHQEANRLPSWFSPPARTRPWGTVHAVLAARDAIVTPFASVNADDFYGAAAYRLAIPACEDAARTGAYSIIGLRLAATLSPHGPVVRGICEVDHGCLTRLDEVFGIAQTSDGVQATTAGVMRRLTGGELASMNFWVFAPGIFDRLDDRFEAFLRRCGHDPVAESLLPEAINELIQAGAVQVKTIEAPGPWFGLTHQEDRPKVTAGLRELVARGEYPDSLWQA